VSFSADTKNELAHIMPEKKNCMLAEIAAIIRVRGNLRLRGFGKFEIQVPLDDPATARHFMKLIKEYFSIETHLSVREGGGIRKGRSYIVTIGPEDLSEQILRETGILMVREGMNYISDGIYEGLVKTKDARKAYLRALFLAAGTMTTPEKDYHFEISCATKILATDVRRLFNSFEDITAKYYQRKDEHVVYLKKADQIQDTLAIMGAHSQYFAFQNVRFQKELKGEANRLANCDQANIDKAIAAADKVIEKINKVGLANLPPKLAEIAVVRMEHPEASLKELGEFLDPPLKKAGVNSRLKRIEALADAMDNGTAKPARKTAKK